MLKLSVVVIGRNEGARLERCLQSLREMHPIDGGVEWIYVDSASTDQSVAYARAQGAQVIELRASRPSAALARNAGWRQAKGAFILFLDGDTILDPAFARKALIAASPSMKIAAVWGHRRELRPQANLFHRVLDLDWVYAAGETEFCGGDVLMRRSALERVNGFSESLIAGEEPELCSRLRALDYSILHIDEPMTQHDLAISTWVQYWRRATRAGYAYANIAWRTRGSRVQLWAAEALANAFRAGALATIVALPVFGGWWALVSLAVLTMLVFRTAIHARWKSNDPLTLLCYGVHSHFQQLPIFAGQLAFLWDLGRNKHRGLIEYK